MQDMQCMVHYDSNYVTLAGHQDHFFEMDMTTGEVYPKEVMLNQIYPIQFFMNQLSLAIIRRPS